MTVLDRGRVPDPCALVIFGASGDLTQRKLVPAIWQLYRQQRLPEEFSLVGVARSDLDDESFRQRMRGALDGVSAGDHERKSAFLSQLFYVRGAPEDPESYTELARRLTTLDGQRGTGGNYCFYCSVPPDMYPQIAAQLGSAGLNSRADGGWVRIVVEKPFGHDLPSARALNSVLHDSFDEEQIFRIDHYLGKETVQNILVFRLANSMFEPLWNRRYIDHVQITAAETVGVEHRAGYYDGSGALRDMIQNHLLQLLCIVAMEPPSAFDAESVQMEKLKVLKAIRPFGPDEISCCAVRAQYGEGESAGIAYRDEEGIAVDSRTETFAALEFTVDNWRWQGVPFYVRTGKCMGRRTSAITLQFKQPPHLIFHSASDLNPGQLSIRIQPEEGISLSFSCKIPGPDIDPGSVEMDFRYEDAFGSNPPEAYEALLLDCLLGDATLFASSEWIERSWELLDPVRTTWDAERTAPIPTYRSGSWGPKEADHLFDRDWRHWVSP